MTIDEALQEAIGAFKRDEAEEGIRLIENALAGLYPLDSIGPEEDPLLPNLGYSMSGTLIYTLIGWFREGRVDPEVVTMGDVRALFVQSSPLIPRVHADDGIEEAVLWRYLMGLADQLDSADVLTEVRTRHLNRLLSIIVDSEYLYEKSMDELLPHVHGWLTDAPAGDSTLALMIEDVERWGQAPA